MTQRATCRSPRTSTIRRATPGRVRLRSRLRHRNRRRGGRCRRIQRGYDPKDACRQEQRSPRACGVALLAAGQVELKRFLDGVALRFFSRVHAAPWSRAPHLPKTRCKKERSSRAPVSRGAVASSRQRQRCSRGTSPSTASMCRPQPTKEGFPHWLHVTREHMICSPHDVPGRSIVTSRARRERIQGSANIAHKKTDGGAVRV